MAGSRSSQTNPPSRFDRVHSLPLGPSERDDPELEFESQPDPRTRLLPDHSRSIITRNDSPDVGFSASVNPYRGCEHGCTYCFARPTHEYLGYSAGLDFETRILVKHDAPELLRKALASPRWKPTVLALSGVTDPYQPAERRLRLTRRCLSLLAEFRNPVAIVTKGYTVTRDLDLLAELASHSAASVSISLTTLDAELQRRMEPRASAPRRRLAAIERLARAGVPVGVLVAPIIPGLTDHEIPALLGAASAAGARFAGRVVLRLPHGLKQLFEAWLREHFPGRADKVLARLRAIHGGNLYDPRFGERQRGSGPFAQQIGELFELARRRNGLDPRGPALSTASFRRPGAAGEQLGLF
jgi:DNA repair photolyase